MLSMVNLQKDSEVAYAGLLQSGEIGRQTLQSLREQLRMSREKLKLFDDPALHLGAQSFEVSLEVGSRLDVIGITHRERCGPKDGTVLKSRARALPEGRTFA